MKSSTTRLFILGIVLAVTLWQLWPTLRFYQLNSEREPLAAQMRQTKSPSDSLALRKWDSLNGEAYRDALARRIKLGLDLRGGIYIAMEVDAPILLLESAQRDAVDEPFQKAINATEEEARLSDESVIDIFVRNFDKIVRPTGKTLLDYYDVGSLGDDASDEAIIKQLSKNIDDAVDQAVEVVRQRIDKYGVAEPTIQKQGGRRIVIELPGADNEEEVRNLLQTTARLEFKLVRDNVETARLFKKIDAVLAGKIAADTTVKKTDTTAAKADTTLAKTDSTKVTTDTTVAAADSTKVDTTKNVAKGDTSTKGDTTIAKTDSTKAADTGANPKDPYAGLSDEEKVKRYRADHPFTSLFQTTFRLNDKTAPQDVSGIFVGDENQFPQGVYEFFTSKALAAKVTDLMNRRDVKAVMPEDIIIAFSVPRDQEGKAKETDPEKIGVQLYVITRDAELTGDVVTNARPDFDPRTGKPIVSMEMNADGAERWASITGKNVGNRVAIVLDSAVYSAPTVQQQITGGSSQITTSGDVAEANLLSVVLKAGALKAPVKIIEERLVGPSLGEDSIRQGVNATLLAALLVMIFMAVYYAMGGVVADLAVVFNLLITLAVLAALGATLTLPGIGGLVLTIGMAVDGNILIYERIREEMAHGRALKSAVYVGYDKAFAAIIDTHITTFMTGAILYFFGTGPIQGFAITLMIGIAATLFTAVFATKTVFMLMLDRGATSMNFGQPKGAEVSAAPARA